MIKKVVFYKNPKVDYLLVLFGGEPIPTKQDKFVPIEVSEILDDGTKRVLNDFYVKKPDKDSIVNFNNLIKETAINNIPAEKKIKKPNHVEVVISVSVTEKRFKEVDVDNLAKCIIDSLNTIAFDDDAQITSLICNKHIHPMKLNGVMIGITMLTPENIGFGGDIKLLGDTPF